METWMVWTISIPLIVIAASFFLFVFFIALKICKIVSILNDVEDKLQALNPLCRIVYRLGFVVDEKLEEMIETQRRRPKGLDIMELALVALSLFKNFRRR